MSKTTCQPVCPSSSPWCWVQTSGSEPGTAPGPAAPAVTAVQYRGPCGPSAWPTAMPWSLLGSWQPRRAETNTWREDALVGAVGIYHPRPPIPTQTHSKQPAPARLPPCPAPSGYKTPLVEGQDGVRGWAGDGCWWGTGPPWLTVPCPCPPIAVLQVSSSPRRRRWPIGCGSLARWPK